MTIEEERSRHASTVVTFEDSYGDLAYLRLARQTWFKVYLAISFALAFLEPFLVAFPSTHNVQVAVLAISSGLFVFGYGCVMVAMRPKENEELSLWKRFREAYLGEVSLEIFAFAIGWGLIFTRPGMAALRIVRVYRFVWFSEFYKARKESPLFAITFYSRLVLEYLESIASEIFTLNSKGGPVVLFFFFFLAYTLGVSFWIETGNLPLSSPEGGPNGTVSECDTLGHCVFVFMRLTFWDGSGFDFIKSLIDSQMGWHALLCIIYMCVSAMVLLNGLIALFGAAFSKVSDEDEEFEDEAQKGERGKKDDDGKVGVEAASLATKVASANQEQLELLRRLDATTQDLARRLDSLTAELARRQSSSSQAVPAPTGM